MQKTFLILQNHSHPKLPHSSNGALHSFLYGHNAEEVNTILSENSLDYILCEYNFHNQNSTNYRENTKGLPYYIYGNSDNEPLINSLLFPIRIFNSALNPEIFTQILEDSLWQELPNFNYFKELNDPALETKMIGLIEEEFNTFILEFDDLLQPDLNQNLFLSTHKISSKFSILGMPKNHQFVKELEQKIRENNSLTEELEDFRCLLHYVYNYLKYN